MKILVFCVCFAYFLVVECRVVPDYLPELCSKSVSDYNACTTKVLSKLGPYLLKGVRDINFPKLNPLHIPLYIANRSVNENVRIFAELKNVDISGYDTTYIKNFRLDTKTKEGELNLHIPRLRATLEYDVIGNIYSLNVTNAGFFKGNATDIELLFKFGLKPVDRLGITYYAFDTFETKSTIDSGHIKLVSKDPDLQFVADLITNFYNENPKLVNDAVQPIYEESTEVFYRKLAEEVLSAIPANELLPE